MIAWKYHTEGPGIDPARMDELGSQGWEAWAVDSRGRVQFKRPVMTAVGASLRAPVMMAYNPPPAQFERAVAFLDAQGIPQWVSATNPLPTV